MIKHEIFVLSGMESGRAWTTLIKKKIGIRREIDYMGADSLKIYNDCNIKVSLNAARHFSFKSEEDMIMFKLKYL